jgi:hypothetical protein
VIVQVQKVFCKFASVQEESKKEAKQINKCMAASWQAEANTCFHGNYYIIIAQSRTGGAAFVQITSWSATFL